MWITAFRGWNFGCQDPGSNWGPFPLQGNALPTELSWLMFQCISTKTAILANLIS